jgi:hypothetical protein
MHRLDIPLFSSIYEYEKRLIVRVLLAVYIELAIRLRENTAKPSSKS